MKFSIEDVSVHFGKSEDALGGGEFTRVSHGPTGTIIIVPGRERNLAVKYLRKLVRKLDL